MNLEKSSLWDYLLSFAYMLFFFFIIGNVLPIIEALRDGSGQLDIISAFYAVSLNEHFQFLILVFYYLFAFCGLLFIVLMAHVAAWLVNCIGIHIQYRKPQRVYPPKNK